MSIATLNKKISQLPMCEERDNLIKQREVLKWIEDGKKKEKQNGEK